MKAEVTKAQATLTKAKAAAKASKVSFKRRSAHSKSTATSNTNTTSLIKQENDAIRRAKAAQAKAQEHAAKAKQHLNHVKGIAATSNATGSTKDASYYAKLAAAAAQEAKSHLNAAKALEAEAKARTEANKVKAATKPAVKTPAAAARAKAAEKAAAKKAKSVKKALEKSIKKALAPASAPASSTASAKAAAKAAKAQAKAVVKNAKSMAAALAAKLAADKKMVKNAKTAAEKVKADKAAKATQVKAAAEQAKVSKAMAAALAKRLAAEKEEAKSVKSGAKKTILENKIAKDKLKQKALEQKAEAAKAKAEAEAKASKDLKMSRKVKTPSATKPAASDAGKRIVFKESPMTMPMPGNLGVASIHSMKMDPTKGMEVHGQWKFPELFVANMTMATEGTGKVSIKGKFDLSHCASVPCKIFASMSGSPTVIFEGSVEGISLPMFPKPKQKQLTAGTTKLSPVLKAAITLPGMGLKLPMMVGPCSGLRDQDLFFAQKDGDICIDFSKTAYTLSAVAGTMVSSAKPLKMPLSALGDKVGMDFSKMKMPSFVGTLSSARIFSAVIRLNKAKQFKGVRAGIKVGTWTHVVTADFDCKPVSAKQEIYDLLEVKPDSCFSLSASSAGEFKASSLIGAGGDMVDAKVGKAAKFLSKLALDKPSLAMYGTKNDFAGTLSGRVKYGNISMDVSITIAGLPKTMKGALKLSLNKKNSLNEILVQMGVNADAAMPDLQIGNIQLYASSGTLNLAQYKGLEVMTGLPEGVSKGLMLNADFNFAASCKTIACKIMTALSMKNLRIQGGITGSGLTLRMGTTLPGSEKQKSTQGFKLPAWADGRLIVPKPWPKIENPLPIIWGPLKAKGFENGYDVKKHTGFNFKTEVPSDLVLGMNNLDKMGLNFSTVAKIMNIDPKGIKTPSFVTVDLTRLAIRTFLVHLKATKKFSAAMVQISLPDIKFNFVVKGVTAHVGFKNVILTAVTDGIVNLKGEIVLEASGKKAPLKFSATLSWREKISLGLTMEPDGAKLEALAAAFMSESQLDKKISLPKLKNGISMAKQIWQGTTTKFGCVPIEGKKFKFKSCAMEVKPPTMVFDFATFTNSSVKIAVGNPFSAQMQLDELAIKSTITLPALGNVTFTTTIAAKGNANAMNADVKLDGFKIDVGALKPALKGITASVSRIVLAAKKNSAGKYEVRAAAHASVDISGFKIIKGIKSFLKKIKADSLTTIKGEVGLLWTQGTTEGQIYAKIDLESTIPANWPFTLQKFQVNMNAKKGDKPEDLVLKGSTYVNVKLGAGFKFPVNFHLPMKTKVFTLTTPKTPCKTMFGPFQICNGYLTVRYDGAGNELKEFKYRGTFAFDEKVLKSKFGALANVIAPMSKVEVYLGIHYNHARGAYMFRLAKDIKIDFKISVFEIQKSTIFFQLAVMSIKFEFGGEIVMKLHIGPKASHPTLTVTMAYSILIQRLELDGHMSGCWKSPFGVKGLEICDVILGAGIGPIAPWLTRFAFGGALNFGKHKFKFGIRGDILDPAKNALVCKYSGSLSILDVIGIAVSIAGKALGKNIKTPTIPFPLFTLKELYVKIAAGTFKVGGETFYMGLTFEAKWVLFGIDQYAIFSVGFTGVLAEFRSKRISLLGNTLQICKDNKCKKEEGPSAKFEIKLIPPKFALQMNGYANIFGVKFGAIVDVSWQVNKAFKANFTAYPISLAGGALKVLASSQSKDKNVKGPSCILDAGRKILTISGRIELWKFSVDGYVEATPTRFQANIVSKLLGFYFKVFLAAGLHHNGIPGGITAGFEAGAPGHEDIRTRLKTMVTAKLNEMKQAGMRAINAAKKKLTDAQAPFNRAAKKVADARAKVNGICRGEEMISIDEALQLGLKAEVDEFLASRKHAARKIARRRLLSAKTATLSEVIDADLTEDMRASAQTHAKAQTEQISDAAFAEDEAVQTKAKWGGRRRRWHAHIPHPHIPHRHHVHVPHRHRPHIHHRHRPHLHVPHFHTAAMIKAAKDAARRAAAAAAKAARDAAARAAKAARDAACAAAKGVAKAALHVAEQAVRLPARVLDAAKLALKGVLAAQHAAFAIMKGALNILPAVTYLKFSLTLMVVIPAAFDFHIKFKAMGKNFDLRLKLNLRDLAAMIKPLVDKAVAYIKSKFRIPSISSFLGEEFLASEEYLSGIPLHETEIVRKSNEEIEYLLQQLDTGDGSELGPDVM